VLVTLRLSPLYSPEAHDAVHNGLRATPYESWSKRDSDGDRWVYVRVPDQKPDLDRMLAIHQRLNVITMRDAARRGVRIPTPYQLHAIGRLCYKPEPKGREWWQTWVDNIREGEGDCEDLASHEASHDEAILGVPSVAECIRSAPRVYHAIVRKPDGRISDPSMPLGLWWYRRERLRKSREEQTRV